MSQPVMTFFSTRLGQFTYFAIQVDQPDWRGRNVLDFGGNIGKILEDPNCTIDHERYWCVDVAREAIDKGKASFPKSHWVFYDRYSFSFNPYGIPNLPVPELHQTFDYILAFSVFTNTTESDMLELVKQLQSRLAKNGVLAFTFLDPDYFPWPVKDPRSNFQWRVDLEIERGNCSAVQGAKLLERTKQADWFTLVNGHDLYIETDDIQSYPPEEQKTCYVFHTEKYMRSVFPHATILPPVNNEMQHCCIIKNT